MDQNSFNCTARLVADPESRTTGTGKLVASFRVAINGFNDEVVWLHVSAWGKTAEFVTNYLRKGSKVALSGRITQRKYEEKTYTEMTADSVVNLDPKPRDGNQSVPSTQEDSDYDPFSDN